MRQCRLYGGIRPGALDGVYGVCGVLYWSCNLLLKSDYFGKVVYVRKRQCGSRAESGSAIETSLYCPRGQEQSVS